jgi:crotonobetainyl-CoA:carnitine CoA-transferase CaiB-like acyl-CoA transferase
MAGPLDGIKILDLTTMVMGPYATQILADFGADVIKVEAPQGDSMRWVWPFRNPGMGHIFLHANRNKRSIVLDLKKDAAREVCLELAAKADVLIYNIRPQAMARLRLDYDEVKKVNAKIVYVGCFGYSQRGPYAAKAAYDDLIQAAAGVPWLSERQGAGSPRYTPLLLADRSVGQQVASVVTAALYAREKTGKGQRVDVPMFEHLLQIVMGEHMAGQTFEPPLGEAGYARMLTPYRRPYRTSDGYVCTLIFNDKQWKGFADLVGKPEKMNDPTFATPEARSQNFDTVYGWVSEELEKRSTAQWIEALECADIPVQRMNSLTDILRDPHLEATDYFRTVEHPSEGNIKSTAVPSEWSETQPEYRRHTPRLGEQTEEILREAGFLSDEIQELISTGAARGL